MSSPTRQRLLLTLIRLALSPTSSPLRNALEQTLPSLLSPDDGSHHKRVLKVLINTYHPSSSRTQIEVLRCLPHDSRSNKSLRKWFAWALLVELPAALSSLSKVRLALLTSTRTH